MRLRQAGLLEGVGAPTVWRYLDRGGSHAQIAASQFTRRRICGDGHRDGRIHLACGWSQQCPHPERPSPHHEFAHLEPHALPTEQAGGRWARQLPLFAPVPRQHHRSDDHVDHVQPRFCTGAPRDLVPRLRRPTRRGAEVERQWQGVDLLRCPATERQHDGVGDFEEPVARSIGTGEVNGLRAHGDRHAPQGWSFHHRPSPLQLARGLRADWRQPQGPFLGHPRTHPGCGLGAEALEHPPDRRPTGPPLPHRRPRRAVQPFGLTRRPRQAFRCR